MSSNKTILAIKELLGMSITQEVKLSDEVKLEKLELVDGTMVEYDKLEAGGILYITAEDGTQTPMPAGKYETKDGKIIETDENGVILSIEDKPADNADNTDAVQQTEMEESVNPLEARFTELENKVNQVLEKFEANLTLSKELEDLKMSIEKHTTAKPLKQIGEQQAAYNNPYLTPDVVQATKLLNGSKNNNM